MKHQKVMTAQPTERKAEMKDYLAGMKAFVAMTIESPEFLRQSREKQYEVAQQVIQQYVSR